MISPDLIFNPQPLYPPTREKKIPPKKTEASLQNPDSLNPFTYQIKPTPD